MRDLFRIYSQLRRQRWQLRARLDRVQRDAMHREQPLEADFAEQAVQPENDEVLAALEASSAGDLVQVEHALERLEAGAYGICEICGMHIDDRRIEALPQVTTCSCCSEARGEVAAPGHATCCPT